MNFVLTTQSGIFVNMWRDTALMMAWLVQRNVNYGIKDLTMIIVSDNPVGADKRYEFHFDLHLINDVLHSGDEQHEEVVPMA